MSSSVVYNEDCLEVMRRYPDGYFDLAVTDPPYGLGIDGQKERRDIRNPHQGRKEHPKRGWDDAIPTAEYFRELERVSKNQIIWGGNYFVEHLRRGHKGWIVWDKGQHGLTMSDCELAYTSFDCPTRVVVINRAQLQAGGVLSTRHKSRLPCITGSSTITQSRVTRCLIHTSAAAPAGARHGMPASTLLAARSTKHITCRSRKRLRRTPHS